MSAGFRLWSHCLLRGCLGLWVHIGVVVNVLLISNAHTTLPWLYLISLLPVVYDRILLLSFGLWSSHASAPWIHPWRILGLTNTPSYWRRLLRSYGRIWLRHGLLTHCRPCTRWVYLGMILPHAILNYLLFRFVNFILVNTIKHSFLKLIYIIEPVELIHLLLHLHLMLLLPLLLVVLLFYFAFTLFLKSLQLLPLLLIFYVLFLFLIASTWTVWSMRRFITKFNVFVALSAHISFVSAHYLMVCPLRRPYCLLAKTALFGLWLAFFVMIFIIKLSGLEWAVWAFYNGVLFRLMILLVRLGHAHVTLFAAVVLARAAYVMHAELTHGYLLVA